MIKFYQIGALAIGCLILFATPNLNAQEVTVFNLEQAISYAQDNHPDIKLKKLQIDDAREQVRETAAIGIPQLNGGIEYQYFIQKPQQVASDFLTPAVYAILFAEQVVEPRAIEVSTQQFTFVQSHNLTPSLTLSSLIFDGSYIVGLRAAKEYGSLVQKDLQVSLAQVRKNVIDSYLPILILDENLKNLDNNITNLQALLKETKAIYEEGFAELLDVDRLQLSLSNLISERDNLKRQRTVALNALKIQMGLPIEQSINIDDNIEMVLANSRGAELIASTGDISNRPEMDYLNTSIKLNELNIDRYRAAYLPSLSAFASYQNAYVADDFADGVWIPNTVVGARLNVPLFAGMGRKAKVARARIDLEKVKLQRDLAVDGFKLELSNARTNYMNAEKRLQSRKENLELAERIYETTKIKYKEGVGSSIEVSNAEQSVYQSQQYYYQAIFELLRAESDLAKALGM